MTRVHTERVRELLAAATPGPWDAGSVSVYATAGCPRHAPDGDPTDVRRCACRIVVADPMDRDRPLIAAAPDLARTVVSLADDVARLTADLAASRQAHAELAALVRAHLAASDRYEAAWAPMLVHDGPPLSDEAVAAAVAGPDAEMGAARAALDAALGRCP